MDFPRFAEEPKRMGFKHFLLPWVLISVISYGQTQKDSVTNLDEIILSENLLKKRVFGETPSTQLEQDQLTLSGPLAINDALNQVSGVYMLSGALNTNRITIRGVGARTPFGTDKLRMYFNGIPVTNGAGTSTLEAFDLENLGSLEVVKGPKATGYGATLGGTLLLNTQPAQAGMTTVNNRFSFGSYSMIKDNLSVSHDTDKMNLHLNYNHLKTDGYRKNSSFTRNGLLLTTSIKSGKSAYFDVLLNHIDYRAEIPSSLNLTDFEDDPTQAAANWLAAQGYEDNAHTMAGLGYTYLLSQKITHATHVFYNYLDHYEARPFNILDEFTNGFGLRSTLKGNLGKGKALLGLEIYKDEYHWRTYENLYRENEGQGSLQGEQLSKNREFRRQSHVFGEYALPISSKWDLQLGLGLNHTFYDYRDDFSQENNATAQRDFDPILLPSTTLSYQMSNGSMYAHIGRGFSNPNLEETLTPDGLINPDIAQEKGVNYELGGTQHAWQRKLRLQWALYRMDIKDLLVAQRVGEDQYIGKNAGKTKHQGLELDLSYQQAINTDIDMIFRSSYSFSDHSFVRFIDDGNDYSGNPLTGVPKHRIFNTLDLKHESGFNFGLTHQFVDAIPLTDANTLYSDAFHLFHLRAGYHNTWSSGWQLGFNAGLNNLFDTLYAQSVLINAVGFGGRAPRYYYPGNGRNYYIGLQLGYKFKQKKQP
ncbi:TonB-dependent receptor family protein [Sediminicola luteus]|nr:TonB-dependent receptor plug domain-containing protein [Sediminicola luteus]